MERESEREPGNLIPLLRDAHWEIRSLLNEMEDILDLPAALFELYPRVRVALEAHDAGEKFALYGSMSELPELSTFLRRAETAHVEIDHTLRILDRIPFRKEQIDSPEWKETFRRLHRTVLGHLAEEEETIFPRLQTLLAEARLDALGERYKRGLKGELGPIPVETRGKE
jgi:hypothetical protein